MKRIAFSLFLLILICVFSFRSEAQNTSNKGKDFWLGYGNHVRDWQIPPNFTAQKLSLYITSDVSTTVTVEIKGIYLKKDVPVTANNITIIDDIPDAARLTREGKYATGIHVTSEKPVVVYSHISASSVSGATLVLPTTTLGKEYVSINFTQLSNETNSFSYFFVVAVEDNTELLITPSVDTQGSKEYPGGMKANTTYPVSLKKGEIYQVLANSAQIGNQQVYTGGDLTGSKIKSVTSTSEPCKRIAVFSGSGKMSIGSVFNNAAGSADNLYQQVYPTAAWGTKYITAPLQSRNYDVYRIVKSDLSAVVKLNGVILAATSFANGIYYTFNSQETNIIESDKPIQVVQYAVSQSKGISGQISEPYGDPEMIFLTPIEQTLSNITMYSASEYRIIQHFVNVIILTKDISSFKIDNVSKAADFKPVPGAAEYSYAQISVSQGTHNLAAGGGFNAIAYGFGAAESYGYAAGANVKSLGIEAQSKSTKQILSSGCVNEPFNFRVTLGYQSSKLSWNLGNGSPVIDVIAPTADSTFVKDGKTYYVYKLNQDIFYNAAKDYTIEVLAESALGDCGSTEIISSEFSIFNPPVAKFTAAAEVCADTGLKFTDQSDGAGKSLTSWNWTFGDGSTSKDQNPTHTYLVSGTYTVVLTITNESSCSPVTTTQIIKVLKRPVANFMQQTVSCAPPVVQFTNTSIANDGSIVKWIWDFGDGKTEERTSGAAFEHTFVASGSYSIKLKVVTDKGCESDLLTRVIIVSPSPVAAFTLPEVCLQDAFAQFTSQSTISDGTEAQFSYLWNFGDRVTSTDKDPKHKYTTAGNFTVSLTVTSNSGCSTVLSSLFTVNGDTPKADFEVQNSNSLCSNKEVVFKNISSVGIGVITKLEWFYDYVNAPAVKFTDENPVTDKLYRHLYPVFNFPASKSFTVRVLAYSGGVCVDEQLRTITVQAVPQVRFDTMSPVCEEASAFQITQASEIHGFNGSSRYSGVGISSSGMFNPAVAGAGTHSIKYIFTAQNGCADSVIRNITVYPTPTLSAGRDTVILEGGVVQLNAKARGNNLTYKWSPSTGLSRDDIADPIASPTDEITYTLTVTSDQGCSTSDDVFLKVLKSPEIPNTFTPNNDGINDTWTIKYLNSYPGCTVSIFNRLGVRVYSSIGYPEAWDGKVNGNDLPVGTYYYLVDPKNNRKMFSGSVSIIR